MCGGGANRPSPSCHHGWGWTLRAATGSAAILTSPLTGSTTFRRKSFGGTATSSWSRPSPKLGRWLPAATQRGQSPTHRPGHLRRLRHVSVPDTDVWTPRSCRSRCGRPQGAPRDRTWRRDRRRKVGRRACRRSSGVAVLRPLRTYSPARRTQGWHHQQCRPGHGSRVIRMAAS